ncbi:MAG: PIG-L deacetylase family protein [Janthinobacterium lividum]
MPKRLMCVVAHPDDECFAFGGALLLAAQAGFETYVVCLTDGQAATNRGISADGADLGKMRREEFVRSCALLKVTRHELLDYQDGQLEFAALSGAARKLVERMRTWQPQIVLTFGLDGSLNVHADHTSVSCFTSLAFHWSARAKRFPDLGLPPFTPQRLYHQSTAFTLADREPLLPAPWTVELDISAVKSQKEAAFREHTSQLPVLEKVQPYWDKYGNQEHYTLAASTVPQPAVLTTSMFEGLED